LVPASPPPTSSHPQTAPISNPSKYSEGSGHATPKHGTLSQCIFQLKGFEERHVCEEFSDLALEQVRKPSCER